jgi:hypothetical protein
MRSLGQGGAALRRGRAPGGRIQPAPRRDATANRAPARRAGAVAGRGHVATGASSGSTPARRALHVAIGVLGWALFAGLWVWQLEVFVPSNWLAGLEALGVILAVFALATPTWVAWNRSIYRRRHRRTTPLVLEVDFERDRLGRTIEADPGVRTADGEIAVEVDGDAGVKSYRATAVRP